jgi:hypothetical protein
MKESEMETVASFLHRAVQIALQAQKEAGTKLLKDFVAAYSGNGEASQQLAQLRKDVVEFSTKFPLPGVPDTVSAGDEGACMYRGRRTDGDPRPLSTQSVIKRPAGY